MSHRLVQERKNRINIMLDLAEEITKGQIKEFNELRKKNKNLVLQTAFENLTWLDVDKFLADMALELGLRNRVLQEYFDILIKAEKFEFYPRNTKKFRAVKPIIGYLAKNPI